MKLDIKNIRYLAPEDWRVLTATEMGSKNHEVVPTTLISQIASLRSGSGVHKSISNLAKIGLIAKVKNAKYDGYRLTYGGLDYLALHTHTKSSTIYSVGNQIGVGKESDIYVCASDSGVQRVLKIHRLGRISFRTVKANRDYLRKRSSGSWMYMSRLAAQKEYLFMQALRNAGFPVPEPLGQNRHTVVMSLIDGFPLRQISKVGDAQGLYAELMALVVKLAQHGLIHGDFNEFNILIEEKPLETKDDEPPEISLVPTLIDFPQMISIDHENAEYYFDRDVACVKRFFSRRFGFTSDEPGPFFKDAIKNVLPSRLDLEVEASGFNKKMAKELAAYMKEVGVDGDASNIPRDDDEDDNNEDEDSDGNDNESTSDQEVDPPDETQQPSSSSIPPQKDPPTPPQKLSTSNLPSKMTTLSIQQDNTDTDPLLSPLSNITTKPPPPQPNPNSTTTKSAKAKAGWAI